MIRIEASFPTKKQFKETQYSYKKTRNGKESVPFLGLESGEHEIEIINKGKCKRYIIKTWLSIYGFAWIVLKEII